MKRSADRATKLMKSGMSSYYKETMGTWKEIEANSLIMYTHNNCDNREKIAGFDMDGTLIITKSGKVFPNDTSDWKIMYNQVIPRLHELYYNEGCKIVIFTNQKGIKAGKVDKISFKQKVELIIAKIGLPIQAFVAIGDDFFRKPCIGMWDKLLANNGGVEVDFKHSFYVGDAAGRHKTKTHPKKDHSNADRLFALNIGIRFETPEQFFLCQRDIEPWGPPGFFPSEFLKVQRDLLEPAGTCIPSTKPELIVMVGYPGSGKSSFASLLRNEYNYAVVSRDTHGTWQKCVDIARKRLKEGTSVVVDNTNPNKEARNRYINLAKEVSVACRCFEMVCDMGQSMHNVRFRSLTRKHVPDVGIMILRMYRNKYEKPDISEGFHSIVHVNFVPNFPSDSDRKLYGQYLVEA